MKDKNLLFSISLTVTLVVLIVLSCALTTERFNLISQALGVPLFIFTIVSFWFSIKEEKIKKCNNEIQLKEEQLKVETESIRFSGTAKMILEIVNTSEGELYSKNQKEIENFKNKLLESEQKSSELKSELSYFEQIRTNSNKHLLVSIFYIGALSLLLLSLVIPEILAPCFSFVKASTLTLISFLFPILEVVVKEPFTHWCINIQLNKLREKTNN